jgi:hypothetical protein
MIALAGNRGRPKAKDEAGLNPDHRERSCDEQRSSRGRRSPWLHRKQRYVWACLYQTVVLANRRPVCRCFAALGVFTDDQKQGQSGKLLLCMFCAGHPDDAPAVTVPVFMSRALGMRLEDQER